MGIRRVGQLLGMCGVLLLSTCAPGPSSPPSPRLAQTIRPTPIARFAMPAHPHPTTLRASPIVSPTKPNTPKGAPSRRVGWSSQGALTPLNATSVLKIASDPTLARRVQEPPPAMRPLPPAVPLLTHPLSSSIGCRPGSPLANVWGPDRLEVLQTCARFTGVVTRVVREQDGDVHLLIRLDPEERNLVNAVNLRQVGGDLVAEIVPADRLGCIVGQRLGRAPGGEDEGTCSGADLVLPAVGAHVEVVGPYVRDLNHGWLEVHPVWSLGPGTGILPHQTSLTTSKHGATMILTSTTTRHTKATSTRDLRTPTSQRT